MYHDAKTSEDIQSYLNDNLLHLLPQRHTLDFTLCASFGPQPAFFISSCRRWKSSWPEAMICLAAHQKHQKTKGKTRHTNMLNNLVSQTNQEPKRNIKSNQLMDLSEGSRKIGYPKAPWINIISIPFRCFTNRWQIPHFSDPTIITIIFCWFACPIPFGKLT